MKIRTILILVPACYLLVKITLFAFRHIFYETDVHLAEHGDWSYLWDDAKNFYSNSHLVRPAFTWSNIKWAWSKDGEVLGVWEPVSLMVKMLVHDMLDFTAKDRKHAAPRLYRILSLCWHSFNVVLAFLVGLSFLRSVNDYDYIRSFLQGGMVEAEGRMLQPHQGRQEASAKGKTKKGGKSSSPSRGSVTRRGAGSKKSGGAANGTNVPDAAAMAQSDFQAYQILLSNLNWHELYTTLGLWLGTITFFAVHPLQAQTIGWISCLSYIISCTFALLSFWGYVAHRNIMRNWRRHLRAGGHPRDVHGPSRIVPTFDLLSASSGSSSPSKRRRVGKGKAGAAASSAVPIEDGHETFLFTIPKVISLICYVCATFCKSPAVTLPLVFIIVDVFIYSYPLSTTAPTKEHKVDANGKDKDANTQITASSGLSSLLPNNVIARFRYDAFPKLWNLTLRSILSWLPFLFTSFVVTIFIIKGNTKHLLDIQTPFERVEKLVWALSWYGAKIIYPSYLVAAVEKMSFSFLDNWEVALSLVAVPYVTLTVLAYSTSSAVGRVVACVYGSFVAILLPSLGLIQHGRLFLAADRYAYLPLLIFGPIIAAVFGMLCTALRAPSSSLPPSTSHLFAGGAIPPNVASGSGSVVLLDCSKVDRLAIVAKIGDGRVDGEACPTDRSQGARVKARLVLSILIFVLVAVSAFFAVKVSPETLLPWRNSMLLWAKNAEIFPETENAHVNLAAAYSTQDDPKKLDLDKALYHAKKALEMRPDSPKYKANLGILYGKRAEHQEGIEVLVDALDVHPMSRWSPLMHKVLGQCLERTGELTKAKSHFERAIALGEKVAAADLKRLNDAIKHDPDAEKKIQAKYANIQEEESKKSANKEKVIRGTIAF